MRSALVLLVLAVGGTAAADASIKVDRLKGGLPPGVKASGPSLDEGYFFGDKNGLNYVLFSSKQIKDHEATGAWLWVDHWIVPPGGKPKLLRNVKELVEPCMEAMTAAWHDGAFGVTDLDGDGYAEVTFAYEVGCHGDVQPNTYKLLLLENGTKYILRGYTRVAASGDPTSGGDFTPDPAEAKWPKKFLAHAKELWDRTADDSLTPPGGPTPGSMDDPGPSNPCGN